MEDSWIVTRLVDKCDGSVDLTTPLRNDRAAETYQFSTDATALKAASCPSDDDAMKEPL